MLFILLLCYTYFKMFISIHIRCNSLFFLFFLIKLKIWFEREKCKKVSCWTVSFLKICYSAIPQHSFSSLFRRHDYELVFLFLLLGCDLAFQKRRHFTCIFSTLIVDLLRMRSLQNQINDPRYSESSTEKTCYTRASKKELPVELFILFSNT